MILVVVTDLFNAFVIVADFFDASFKIFVIFVTVADAAALVLQLGVDVPVGLLLFLLFDLPVGRLLIFVFVKAGKVALNLAQLLEHHRIGPLFIVRVFLVLHGS